MGMNVIPGSTRDLGTTGGDKRFALSETMVAWIHPFPVIPGLPRDLGLFRDLGLPRDLFKGGSRLNYFESNFNVAACCI